MKTILYLTDLYYQANGRNYYEEDLYVTSRLKDYFNVLIGNPRQAISFLAYADFIVFRNTGPVIYYQEYFNRYVEEIKSRNVITFNSMDGKADMKGKQYLLDLFHAGFPVVPTVATLDEIHLLGDVQKYVLKLKHGADSIGMQILDKHMLTVNLSNEMLIQPLLDFQYEVSFYYLNNEFQYALYAPDKQKRWELKLYEPTADDLKFADEFIRWNNMQRGISRVDACRLQDSSLLLVELEDLNPFLSLNLLPDSERESFIRNLIAALSKI